MSLGGEVSGASAYLAEIAPPNRRGRYSSFFYVSIGTAVLLASLLGAFLASTLTDDQLVSGHLGFWNAQKSLRSR
jgi:MFS transporter, MHS family, alpha-ketoglutarate permease